MSGELSNKQDIIKKDFSSEFPEWYVCISFVKSTSKNYTQAIALAQMAPKYIEQTIDGNILHQAIYSHKPDDYLAFINLYELINNWKSSFVAINGQLVDRKIIGGINYCYGDKCRSGNPEFCYGASQFTKNPFGCHRLQVSQYNHPWWSFGDFDNKGIWHVNKKEIHERIKENAKPYYQCPAFSLEKVKEAFNNLPDKINPDKEKEWVRMGNEITNSEIEKNRVIGEYNININLSIDDVNNNNNNKNYMSKETSAEGCGCFTISMLSIIIIFILIILI